MDLPDNFYKGVEVKGSLKHILYSDTDSIFISIPMKNADQLSVEDRWKLAEHNATKINESIVEYVTKALLPRCNISPEHNETFFKTEMLIDSALFLDVKKNYAYKLSCKEGVVLDSPKVKYTGIQVVKSDAAKMTQNLLKDMIENVMLNEKIKRTDRIKELAKIVDKFKTQFDEAVKNFQFNDIGFPGKWSKREMFIDGMTIYNFITGEEVFNLGSSGKFIHCRFNNSSLIRQTGVINMKSPGLCVPYEYDIRTVKQKMQDFQISIDPKVHWDKLFTTACRRIIDLAKAEIKNINSIL